MISKSKSRCVHHFPVRSLAVDIVSYCGSDKLVVERIDDLAIMEQCHYVGAISGLRLQETCGMSSVNFFLSL